MTLSLTTVVSPPDVDGCVDELFHLQAINPFLSFDHELSVYTPTSCSFFLFSQLWPTTSMLSLMRISGMCVLERDALGCTSCSNRMGIMRDGDWGLQLTPTSLLPQ